MLRYTLDELHRSGFDSVYALRAITSTAATVIGVAERKGRISPGKDADIIAIAGDPTLEGSTELLVNAVWLGGTRIR